MGKKGEPIAAPDLLRSRSASRRAQTLDAQEKIFQIHYFIIIERRMHIDDKEKMYESWKDMLPGFSNEVL
ncbi:hypothetical protein LCGC14_2735730 [marine sediment metagenome]|uniref:Uncharacterized protein n=1 Tax=marine sediment metagenome TaxID=412755 RepID=A0A0F9BXK3_9ZZZZ